MCVLWISILPLSTIFGLEFGTIYALGCFFLLLFCMFFSLPIRFFYFQTIYLYIYTTTAVQTEKQKNVLNLEPLSVVL